jgi:hypothetical protein
MNEHSKLAGAPALNANIVSTYDGAMKEDIRMQASRAFPWVLSLAVATCTLAASSEGYTAL